MTDIDDTLCVYGTESCPDVRLARAYLDRHGVDYRFCDIDQDPDVKAALEALSGEDWVVPTIVFPDGTVMENPSIRELADELGRPPRQA